MEKVKWCKSCHGGRSDEHNFCYVCGLRLIQSEPRELQKKYDDLKSASYKINYFIGIFNDNWVNQLTWDMREDFNKAWNWFNECIKEE